jgi:hypothetical protein
MSEKALVGYLRFGPLPCFLVGGFQAKGDNAVFVQTLDDNYRIERFSEFEPSSAAEWIDCEGTTQVRRVGGQGLLAVLVSEGNIISGNVNELKQRLLHLQTSLNDSPFFRYEALKFLQLEKDAARAICEAAKLFSSRTVAENWAFRELEALRPTRNDPDKHAAVSALVESASFSATHVAIARLLPFLEELDFGDIRRIADAITSNNQINWIYGDSDVSAFLARFKELYSVYIRGGIVDAIDKMVNAGDSG